MRVLFVVSASLSHLAPMVPLAWGLRGAGHEVVVACEPGTAQGAVNFGLTAAVVGSETRFDQRYRELEGERREGGSSAVELFAETAELMVDDLVELGLRWRPDLVVHDPVAFAAEIAASRLEVAAVRHLWGPDVLATDQGRWLADSVRERLGEARQRHHAHAAGDPLLVDPSPPDLQLGDGVPRQRCRFVPVDRPGKVPADLVAETRSSSRLCVTWGTSAAERNDDHPLVDALPRLAAAVEEVLLAVPAHDADKLGSLPANIRPVVDVPLHRLLPACAAVVHHGGAGTMLGAAVAAVPQLVVSDGFETSFNGSCLSRAGCGRHLTAVAGDGDSVAAAAVEVLEDTRVRESAGEVRSRAVAEMTPLALARRLPALVGMTSTGSGGTNR